jgi:predicted phage terminase large subunit-like protein
MESYGQMLAELDEIEYARLAGGDWWAEAGGNILKREWFAVVPRELVPDGCEWVRYWDLAATEPDRHNPDPDYSAGALMAYHPLSGRVFVVEVVRVRKDPADTEDEVRAVAHRDGPGVPVRIEQVGADGKNTVSHYSRNVLPGYNVDGHKVSGLAKKHSRRIAENENPEENSAKVKRVKLWSPRAKRKELVLVRGYWNTDFLDEAQGFPSTSPHDDQVDAVSGGFEVLTGIGTDDADAELIV